MAQNVGCPECRKVISLPDTAAGKKVRCSACQAVCRIHENSEGDLFLEALHEGEVIPDHAPQGLQPRGRRNSAAAPRGRQSSSGGRSRSRGGSRSRYSQPSGDVAAFVLGLCSLLICGAAAPFGLAIANRYQRDCRRARIQPSGLGTAGLVLSGLGIVWMIVQVIYMAVMWKVIMTKFYGS